MESALRGSMECTTILVRNGANVNLQNKYQNTALHIAAVNNEIDICSLLLENKADIMKKNYVRHHHCFIHLNRKAKQH